MEQHAFHYVNLESGNLDDVIFKWPTLIFHMDSDFVNGTALCKFYGRSLTNWTCTNIASNLVKSWQKVFPDKPHMFVISNNKLVEQQFDTPKLSNCGSYFINTADGESWHNAFDGTYMHANFIPFLFMWLDYSAVIPACETIFKHFKYQSDMMQEVADAVTQITADIPLPIQCPFSNKIMQYIQETEAQVLTPDATTVIPVVNQTVVSSIGELKTAAADKKRIKSRKQPGFVFQLAPGEYQLAFSKKAGEKIKQSCPNAVVLDQFHYDAAVIKSDVVCSELKKRCENLIRMKRCNRRFKLLADNCGNTDQCVKVIKELCA